MAKTTLLCISALLFLVFNLAYSKAEFALLKPWEIEEDASDCTDDLDTCKCIAAKPGRCANDVEIRGACAASCNACSKKKRNPYLGELSKLKKRFIRKPAFQMKRGCADTIEDCDCMASMCNQYKDYMASVCPHTCGFC